MPGTVLGTKDARETSGTMTQVVQLLEKADVHRKEGSVQQGTEKALGAHAMRGKAFL